jgi:hypothetical protein
MHTLICFGDSITAGWNGCEDTPRLTDRLKADLSAMILKKQPSFLVPMILLTTKGFPLISLQTS